MDFEPNAASTRGFVVEAKPQRKSRRCARPGLAWLGILLPTHREPSQPK
ncbi:hypothetical protein MRBBS_2050 [Marinobacter sp. BSs20148]|nr:hypothetical protein MRBBS_2050 [Marinobacter sp. BSs20148]